MEVLSYFFQTGRSVCRTLSYSEAAGVCPFRGLSADAQAKIGKTGGRERAQPPKSGHLWKQRGLDKPQCSGRKNRQQSRTWGPRDQIQPPQPRRSKVRFATTSFYARGKKDVIRPLPCSSFPTAARSAGLTVGRPPLRGGSFLSQGNKEDSDFKRNPNSLLMNRYKKGMAPSEGHTLLNDA